MFLNPTKVMLVFCSDTQTNWVLARASPGGKGGGNSPENEKKFCRKNEVISEGSIFSNKISEKN